MKKNFAEAAKRFLRKQKAKVLETSQKGPLTPLLEYKLEFVPKRPHFYIEWDKVKLLVFVSDKDELFHAKDGTEKTGGDWPTFQFLNFIEAVTQIPIILLIHDKQSSNWLIRQLSQLPKPELGWRDRCLAFQYKRQSQYWNCSKCWTNHPYTANRCMKKKQPTALWNSDEFINKILIQKSLWQGLNVQDAAK